MTKQLIVIGVIIVIVLFASQTILGQFSSLRLIGSTGKVTFRGVGVYWDANCSSRVDSLDWESVAPGSNVTKTVFIRNEGNEESDLFLNTTNWSPSNAADYITLTWDYNDYTLYPGQTREVMLTLSIALITEGIKDFNFDIIIGVNEEA